MKAYWQKLEGRDKHLAILLLSTLLLAAGYWLLWQPLQTELANTQRKINVQTQTLQEVKVLGQKITELQGGSAGMLEVGDLNQLVNRTALRNQISISRIQAKTNAVQIWIDDVNFNQFISWLENLNKQYGIEIQNIDISAVDHSGMIKVRRLQLGKTS